MNTATMKRTEAIPRQRSLEDMAWEIYVRRLAEFNDTRTDVYLIERAFEQARTFRRIAEQQTD